MKIVLVNFTRRGNHPMLLTASLTLRKRMGKFFGGVVIVVLLLFIFNVLLGGLATEYVLEFWLTYAKGHPVDVAFFPCMIAGLFLGEVMVPAAVVTWIISSAFK